MFEFVLSSVSFPSNRTTKYNKTIKIIQIKENGIKSEETFVVLPFTYFSTTELKSGEDRSVLYFDKKLITTLFSELFWQYEARVFVYLVHFPFVQKAIMQIKNIKTYNTADPTDAKKR